VDGSLDTFQARPRPRPLRRRRKGEITAERILDAAEEHFANHGYEGTTLRDVASAVGLRTPSLYNHFDSKDALYAAVLERGIAPVLATLARAAVEGDARGELDPGELVEALMPQLAQRPNLPRLIAQETLRGGDHLSPMLRKWIQPLFDRADRMIESGPAAKRFSADQLPLLVLAMYNIVVGYFSVAPLYKELNGTDLLDRRMVARQTQLFSELVRLLFGSAEE